MQVPIADFQSGCAMASQPLLADLAVAQVWAQVQIHQACRALECYVKTAIAGRMVAVDQALAVDSQQLLGLGMAPGLILTQAALLVDQALAHAPLAHVWLLMAVS